MKTLDELDALHAAAWPGPWTAETWEVECDPGWSAGGCPTGEDCEGSHDCETILAPEAYPDGQVVVQTSHADGRIMAPGLEQFARANTAAIVALKNAWPAFSARLRAAEAEVERLRGEVASLALLVSPQAARDAAATERENRAARAILTRDESGDLVDAARAAMAMADLYRTMCLRNEGYTRLASQALTVGLAECERLRGQTTEQRALLRWFLDGDDHTHEDDCGARGQHDRDVCRVAGCGDAECEGPHCTCDATEMRDRARAALGEP